MANNQVYECTGHWTGDLMRGEGSMRTGAIDQSFSVPGDMGGPGLGTNPEELLAAAANGCYLMTLAGLLGAEGIPYAELSNRTVALFSMSPKGPQLTAIRHSPLVRMPSDARALFSGSVQSCIVQAEKACMVSQSMAGNVKITAEGKIESELESA